MKAVRWNIAVSPDTDQSVRLFLASNGGISKGDLSKFIEAAVRSYIFDQTVEMAKVNNAGVREEDLLSAVNGAVTFARQSP